MSKTQSYESCSFLEFIHTPENPSLNPQKSINDLMKTSKPSTDHIVLKDIIVC
jgi:hypothetical protein